MSPGLFSCKGRDMGEVKPTSYWSEPEVTYSMFSWLFLYVLFFSIWNLVSNCLAKLKNLLVFFKSRFYLICINC